MHTTTISIHFEPAEETQESLTFRLYEEARRLLPLTSFTITHLFPEGRSAELRSMFTIQFNGGPPPEICKQFALIPGVKVAHIAADRRPR